MSTILSFVSAHSVALSAFGVAVVDFVWAMNPNAKANGILHAIYSALGGKDPGQGTL